MTQLDDLQTYTNTELPKRRVLLKPADVGSYDGNPNLSSDPVILASPLGTWYHEPTADRFWAKDGAGDWSLSGGGGSDRTAETLTIELDQASGTDPASGTVFTTQAEVTAHGAFQTIDALFDALPRVIAWPLTISVTGDYQSTGRKFLPWINDKVLWWEDVSNNTNFPVVKFISTNGAQQVSGTPQLDVASSSGQDIILDSDPGLTADAFAGYFVEVVSGTGVGGKAWVLSHSGTALRTDISMGVAADSVLEIRESSGRIFLDSVQFAAYHNSNTPVPVSLTQYGLEFEGCDVVSIKVGGQLMFMGGVNLFLDEYSCFRGIRLQLFESSILFDKSAISLNGESTTGPVVTLRDSFFRCRTTGRDKYLGNNTGSGPAVSLESTSSNPLGSGFYGIGITIHRVGIGLRLYGNVCSANLRNETKFESISSYVFMISNGAQVISDWGFGNMTIAGGVADFLVQGVEYSLADVLAQPEDSLTTTGGCRITTAPVDITAPGRRRAELDAFQRGSYIPATLVPTGTTETIDWDNGNSQLVDLESATGDVTLTLSNGLQGARYSVKFIQGSTARQLTWPGSVTWRASTPTLPTGNDEELVVDLWFDGTTYYASYAESGGAAPGVTVYTTGSQTLDGNESHVVNFATPATYTLPTPVVGARLLIHNISAASHTVAAGGSETITHGTTTALSSVPLPKAGALLPNTLELVAIDATTWAVVKFSRAKHCQYVTVTQIPDATCILTDAVLGTHTMPSSADWLEGEEIHIFNRVGSAVTINRFGTDAGFIENGTFPPVTSVSIPSGSNKRFLRFDTDRWLVH